MGLFKMVFYTKYCFVKDSTLRYEGGDRHAYNGQDNDYWSSFKPQDLTKVMDSDFNLDGVKMWWKHEGSSLQMMRMCHCYFCLLRKMSVKLKFILTSDHLALS